jgi:hypothetical protein
MLPDDSLTLKQMRPRVHRALRNWPHAAPDAQEWLEGLLLVHEARKNIAASAHAPVALRKATNEVLLDSLHLLRDQDDVGAQLLKERFIDGCAIKSLALKYNRGDGWISHTQVRALDNLTRIIITREIAARAAYVAELQSMLPVSAETRLFGIDLIEPKIRHQLLDDDALGLIAITGVGGIGKTVLAGRVAQNIATAFYFEHIIWLELPSRSTNNIGGDPDPEAMFEQLLAMLGQSLALPVVKHTTTAIASQLRQRKSLIIIDNLEEPADIAYFLPHLSRWTQPGRILLTSRAVPHSDIPVTTFALGELSPSAASALMDHHAGLLGLLHRVPLTDGDRDAIYAIVGGNPLALKVVVSMMVILPLAQILTDLHQGQSLTTDQLYRRIFFQAWHTISDDSRCVLLAMPFADEHGMAADHLLTISGLDAVNFWRAVPELLSRSLLEMQRRSSEEHIFRIHAIVEAFLRNDVIRWEPDGEKV